MKIAIGLGTTYLIDKPKKKAKSKTKIKFKRLTKKQVEAGRSSAYQYVL